MLTSVLSLFTGKFGRGFVALLACCLTPALAQACPFCSAPARTLSEDLAASDVIVFAKLVERGAVGADPAVTATDQRGEAKFEITKLIKGSEHLAGSKKVEAFYFGDAEPGAMFLITGMVLPEIKWTTPLPLSARGEKYVSSLPTLPEKGPERLAFFWEYLEDEDSLLAQDSYDEFARAAYSDVISMKGTLDRERLIDWINSPDLAQSRRRLYFTLLGVCGQPEDIGMLEGMMKSNDRRAKAGLDALIGCYLALNGPQGMPLIEELFLKKKDSEYSDTYAAIMALRVMGQESQVVPRSRLLEGLRYMLDRPDLADLVIPDLARWEDWSVMDRMIQLFKDANPSSNFVRVPVVNYLEAASRQKGEVGERAKAAIDELAKIDPEAVKRAKAYAIFGPLAAPKPTVTSDNKKPADTNGDQKASAPVEKKEPASTAKPKKAAAATKQPVVAPGKSSSLQSPADALANGSPANAQVELLVVPTGSDPSALTYVSCGGSDTASADETNGSKITKISYLNAAETDSAGSPSVNPAENEAQPTETNNLAPANVEVAKPVKAEAADTTPIEVTPAEAAPARDEVVVLETVEVEAEPNSLLPGQTLDLDRTLGGRRVAMSLGLIAAVLVCLRVVASRVGSASTN